MTTKDKQQLIKKIKGLEQHHSHSANFQYNIDRNGRVCKSCERNLTLYEVIELIKETNPSK